MAEQEKRKRGRPSKPPGTRVRDQSPTKRGFSTAIMPKATYEKLTAYRDLHHIDSDGAAIDHALTQAIAPHQTDAVPATQVAATIPWDDVRSGLLDQLGWDVHMQRKVDAAIAAVKPAQE